jgi:hypothetical protein
MDGSKNNDNSIVNTMTADPFKLNHERKKANRDHLVT